MRVLIIGLDCVPPTLVFEHWAAHLPHLNGLAQCGAFGPLRSTRPPITVPAWASMTSGRDPGELGLYGFRNRHRSRDYDLRIASSKDVRVKRLWDRVGESGRRVAALFVPLTSPVTPVRGQMVGCFLHREGPRSFPPAFLPGLEERFGAYLPDVSDFRSDQLERIFGELEAMREQHFDMAEAVWTEEHPDFLMMVEMGPDRLHHAAWHHFDHTHPRYEPGNPWEQRALAYYVALDARVGRLVALAGEDTLVLVVSDHGARAMERGVALNEALRELGWLDLADGDGVAPLRERVRWQTTRAWAEGGYYGRLFLNVAGREPSGVVDPSDYEATRDSLLAQLRARLAEADVHLSWDIPEETYAACRGEAPDAMLYLDDLRARALGTVGHGSLIVPASDTGPDGCNHDWNGLVIAAGPGVTPGRIEGASILDVAPTVLSAFGLSHDELQGTPLSERARSAP